MELNQFQQLGWQNINIFILYSCDTKLLMRFTFSMPMLILIIDWFNHKTI